jgi:uncharacterized protein (DUF4415 family)
MRQKPRPELLDKENPEWTTEAVARARPAREVLPQIFSAELAQELLKPRGRPRVQHPKERINIRLSPEVLTYFKAAGDGWQTRIDAALRRVVAEQAGA